MQATTVVLVVFFAAILIWALWAWWKNPWRRIRHLLYEESFTFMECKNFPGKEFLYSETLWIEVQKGSQEFRITFRDVPGGECKEGATFSVTPRNKLYREIAIIFNLHKYGESVFD